MNEIVAIACLLLSFAPNSKETEEILVSAKEVL